MNDEHSHSPAPWSWTEFGVLSDAKGQAILDCDNWNVPPEDAVVISTSPELLTWIRNVLEKKANAFSPEEINEARQLLKRATNPTKAQF